MKTLLTTSNPKTSKGTEYGYLTAVLHLAPFDLSGRNVCPYASAGCAAACLNTAGRGGISKGSVAMAHDARIPDNAVQACRIDRTNSFFADRNAFIAQLIKEIGAHVQRATNHGLRAAVRLNGTSDLRWERIAPELFTMFPWVTFYDYTKDFHRMVEWCANDLPVNYHLTFSRSETNDTECSMVLRHGGSVAVVFDTPRGGALPSHYRPTRDDLAPVHDADTHDLRFLDPAGSVAGLRAKGRARHDASGFVVRTYAVRTK